MAGFVVLGISILGAAFLLSRANSARLEAEMVTNTPVVGQFDTIRVPVPVEPVAAGTKLRDVKFRTVSFPKHQVPQGAVSDLTPLLDAVAVAPLPADLPLFRKNVSLNGGASNPVIERIPDGMRAMTIRVDATSAVEGWAGSGAVVDVLLAEKDRTSVVAEKVKILSAERSVSPVQGVDSPNVPSTVTLLVTQEQCLAINTAIPLGKIAFALRSTQDGGNWGRTEFSATHLKGGGVPMRRQSEVRGYVTIKGKEDQSFALTDGKWTSTEVIPEGFLASEKERILPSQGD